MGLVVHAVHALDYGLLHLLDDLAALAGVRVDPVYPLVVHLQFEVLGPAAGGEPLLGDSDRRS